MIKTDSNPRRDFLKKIPVAIASIGAFSFLKFNSSKKYVEKKFETISMNEANELIRNNKFSIPTQLKPKPAPNTPNNIQG